MYNLGRTKSGGRSEVGDSSCRSLLPEMVGERVGIMVFRVVTVSVIWSVWAKSHSQ